MKQMLFDLSVKIRPVGLDSQPEGLEDRVLYMDTDSAIYIHRDGELNPPLGDYLEDLKKETK